MQPTRIAELLAPFLDDANGQRLTTGDLEHISTYIDILIRWNARINLTAIRDPEQIVTRHFGESLFAARHLFPNRTARHLSPNQAEGRGFSHAETLAEQSCGLGPATLADIGSGAGFPGIPIKLWTRDLSVALIESNHKKVAFLRELVRCLTLTDIDILNERAESLSGRKFDLVTLRAVERFDSILPTAARLVAPQGRLALFIGSSQSELARCVLARLNAGLETRQWPDSAWSAPLPIPRSRSRILAIAHRSSN